MRQTLCILAILVAMAAGCNRPSAPVDSTPPPEVKTVEKKGADGVVEFKSSVPNP
jgi:hypothetical protein